MRRRRGASLQPEPRDPEREALRRETADYLREHVRTNTLAAIRRGGWARKEAAGE